MRETFREDKFLNGYRKQAKTSLCGSNVRWKTVPESTASSGKSTIADSHHKMITYLKTFIRLVV